LVAGCANSQAKSGTAEPPELHYIDFEGVHQPGVWAMPVPALTLAAAFDSVAIDRDALITAFKSVTEEIRGLMTGHPPEQKGVGFPPVDSGVMGPEPPPDNLSIVMSVGASLFDDRYGLKDQRPTELVKMPFFSNDRLDPTRSNGDVLFIIEAESPDTMQFALRQLMRSTRDSFVLKWKVDGYSRGTTPVSGHKGAPRNLMGFKDGTSNLDVADDQVMDSKVWVGPADADEPTWSHGGSYQVIRQIRMLVEFWDRTTLGEQERLMGRHKISGAPIGMGAEADDPSFTNNPADTITAADAHIRLANPRSGNSDENLILRRGFSYTRDFDRAGQLDQGLAYVSYQKSLEKGFIAIQNRLNGEPLEEYIKPEGGGYFFVLPGVSGNQGYLGEGLLST